MAIRLKKLTPMLRTWDMRATLSFYTDILGFACEGRDEESGWALLRRDDVAVMLSGPNAHLDENASVFTGSLYFRTDNVDSMWDQLKDRTRVCYPIEDFDYGMREFGVFDNNGYLLQFGRPAALESTPATAGVTRESLVSLREITADTVSSICRLSVREDQKQFVAANAVSIAQAHFSDHAWFRAVYADETPVGFIMLEDRPEIPSYYLWRFMIDGRYQGLGFGRKALELLIAHVRARPGAVKLDTSVVQGDGSPQGFYEGLGFRLTGDVEEGEAVMRLELGPP